MNKLLAMMFANANLLPEDVLSREAALARLTNKEEAQQTAQIEPCHFCGSTEPLDTSYSDEGHGWPFCPQCKGV